MTTRILTPPLNSIDFISKLAEGRDLLSGAAVLFADARLDAVRVIRHSVDGSGRLQSHDGCFLGLGLRVLGRGGFGFSVTEGEVRWERALSRASALAEALTDGQNAGISLAPAAPLEVVEPPEVNIIHVPPQRLDETVQHVREAIPQAEIVRADYLGCVGWRGVVNSEGTLAVRSLAYGSINLTCFVRSGERRLVPLPITDRTVGPDDLVQRIIAQLDEAREIADQLATSETLQPRQCPVVLGPSLAGLLIHEAFGHLCEADRLPLCGIQHLPRDLVIGPPDLEIWDCPDVPGACGALPFDDEGVESNPVPLVSSGRWVGLLHSRSTASLHGSRSFGNARVTSFRHIPLCRMRVTKVKPGCCEPADMLAGIHDGVFLDIPHGGHIRGAGFRLGAINARRIIRGKLATPLSGAVLEGEPLVILRQIDAIGHDQRLTDRSGECSREDQRNLPVSTFSPSIRLRQAKVSS